MKHKKTILYIKRPPEGDGESTADEAIEEAEASSDTVKVSNIPSQLHNKDTLHMFFENARRSGGGDIRELNFDEESATALISFRDAHGCNSHYIGFQRMHAVTYITALSSVKGY